uniref:Calcium load-activated calcium channel n=1 Tax=Strix occidentalis caurina TaxID=311401 RepID=A0A8D0ELU7_STROC
VLRCWSAGARFRPLLGDVAPGSFRVAGSISGSAAALPGHDGGGAGGGVATTMSTMFADTLLIVFISVCTALLAEGITWVLVYRTDKYKRLKAEVEKQSKKCKYFSDISECRPGRG